MRYSHLSLTTFATTVLTKAGLPNDRASLVAEVLVCSDLMGHTTHGLQLLLPYAAQLTDGLMTIEGEPDILKDQGSAVTWDGRHLPGPYLVQKAIDLGIDRLSKYPMVTVSIGKSHHIACLAAYLEQVTEKGLMILLLSSDPGNQTVAPFGGLTGAFSPDPLAYGIPTEGLPILFDSSASAVANGVVMQKHAEGEKLGGKWLLDTEGKATDDPQAFFDDPPATILPVGGVDLGFKGFGYALLIEALTSGLAGKGRKDTLGRWSASVMVQLIDPSQFGGSDSFKQEMQYLMNACLKSQPANPAEPIRMPGHRAIQLKQQQLIDGVELHPRVRKNLIKCAEKYDLPMIDPLPST